MMTDVHSKAVRSYNMSQIKGRDTRPEILVRKFLFSKGFRYKLNVKSLPGKPDIVLPKYKTVIFINGCFWHGHQGCPYFVVPKTRTEWWLDKINGTILRDKTEHNALAGLGWRVLVIWECQLKATQRELTLANLNRTLNTDTGSMKILANKDRPF